MLEISELEKGESSSSVSGNESEPDINEKKRTILKWKEELDKMHNVFHDAASKIGSGFHNFKIFRTNENDSDKGGRNLRIEYRGTTHHRRKKMHKNIDGNSIKGVDYSHYLDLLPISNGRFQANFDLNNLPPEGDVTLKVCGENLNIYIHNSETCKRGNKIGTISLPMFIDPMTLEFEILDDDKLRIQAKLKGLLSRQKSISSDSLSVLKNKKSKHPILRKQTHCNSDWNILACIDLETLK